INDGNGFTYTGSPVWNPSFCASYQTCFMADINGDGKSDIVAITQDFGIVWYSLSNGSSFGPNRKWNNQFWCARAEVCMAGDVNGDRKADLILFKPHATGVEKGNVLVAREITLGLGLRRTPSWTDIHYGHGFFCIDNESCYVADFNGDG